MADGGTREFGVTSQMKKLHIRSNKLPPIIDFAISKYNGSNRGTRRIEAKNRGKRRIEERTKRGVMQT